MKISRLIVLICALLLLTACEAVVPPETTQPETVPSTAATMTVPTTEPATESSTVPATQPTDPPAIHIGKGQFETLFYQEGTWNGPVDVNYYNRILWCDFTSPEQVDLQMIFFDQDLDENWELTAEEESFLRQQGLDHWFHEEVPVKRVSAEKVNTVLEQCFGLTLEETDLVGMDSFVYFADTDCYYWWNGSHGACHFEISKAIRQPDDTITVEYQIHDANDWKKVITLEKTESGYRVLSNVTLPREAQSPDFEPTLKQQEISGRYFSDEADGFTYTEAQDWFAWEPILWRKDPKYRCISRHELTEGALYEYCLSKDSITLIEERPVLEYTMTREYYYYILKEDPATLWQKPRTGEPASVLYTSDKGDITDLSFYGYENDGELVFVLDNTYVMFYWLPRMEITQVYEGNRDIDVCLYNRQFKCLHIRDMKWQFWEYYLEDGKLEGPFE